MSERWAFNHSQLRCSLILNAIYFVSANVGFTALRLDSRRTVQMGFDDRCIRTCIVESRSLTAILVFIQKVELEISMYVGHLKM